MPFALPFGDLLDEHEIARFEVRSPNVRKRIYTSFVTLKAFLSQVVGRAGSCQEAVNGVHLESINALNESCSLNTSSYSRARNRLNLNAVRELTKEIHQGLSENVDESWLWKKKKVGILDGSTVAMADTAENVAAFPKRRNLKPHAGYPIARVMLASSLETGSVIDFDMAPYKGKCTGEIPLGAGLLKSFEPGSVLLADAMFVSYSFIGLCKLQQLDFLAPKKSNRKFTVVDEKKIGVGDRLICVRKPCLPHTGWISQEKYDTIDNTIWLRETEIRFRRNGFRTKKFKILSTFLDAEKYSTSDLTELSLNRWNIELDLRIIKRELGVNFLACKTPEMVKKEIWVNLLAFNLIRKLINKVSKKGGVLPRQISFKNTLDYYLKSYQNQCFKLVKMPSHIANSILKFRLRKQIDRFEPRARKSQKGSNDFPTLSIPRSRWKLLQLMPDLNDLLVDLEFSSDFIDGLEKVKKQIPIANGKARF
jgi:hypothetical protein